MVFTFQRYAHPMVFTAALLLFALFCIVTSVAENVEITDRNQQKKCDHPLVPGNWNAREQWAWNERLCLGMNHVNFEYFPDTSALSDNFNCTNRQDTVLSSAFFWHILRHQPTREVLSLYGITTINLTCATVPESLILSDLRSENTTIMFTDFELANDVRADNSTLNGLRIWNSNIRGDLILNNANISDRLELIGTAVDGHIRARYSVIGRWEASECRIGHRDNPEADESTHLAQWQIHYLEIDPWGIKTADLSATQFSDLHFSDCLIYGDVTALEAHVGRVFKVDSSVIRGLLAMNGMQIEGTTYFRASTITGGIDSRRSAIGGDFIVWGPGEPVESDGEQGVRTLLANEIEVKGNIDLTNLSWTKVDLSESHVHGMLTLFNECPDLDSAREPELKLRKLWLRNARIRGIHDWNRPCLWTTIDPRFEGWEYDGRRMTDMLEGGRILDRDVSWLGDWVGRKLLIGDVVDRPHYHQPYTQLADSLNDLGRSEEAKEIRILEREERLNHLRGAEGIWQWLIGRTTRFGYAPERAALGLVALIGIGTIYIWLSNRSRRPNLANSTWVHCALFLLFLGSVIAFWIVASMGWHSFGYIALASSLVIGILAAYLSPPMELRNRPSITSALLYSIDRAVPFLSFDSEHVDWFKNPQRLNDMTFLCIYFYLHSIIGFALTSLFVAAFTGILR